jgi:hypothetical protein
MKCKVTEIKEASRPLAGAVAVTSIGALLLSQLYVCGGYIYDDSTSDDSSMSLGEYVSSCQKFVDKNSAW